jgi:hypothetical protein
MRLPSLLAISLLFAAPTLTYADTILVEPIFPQQPMEVLQFYVQEARTARIEPASSRYSLLLS